MNLYNLEQKMKTPFYFNQHRTKPVFVIHLLFCLCIGLGACNRGTPTAEDVGTNTPVAEESPELAVHASTPFAAVPPQVEAATEAPTVESVLTEPSKTRLEDAGSQPATSAAVLSTTALVEENTQPLGDPLATARQSIEYGNTALARTQMSTLLEGSTGNPLLSAQIYFLQTKSYLTDGLYGDALALAEQMSAGNSLENSTVESPDREIQIQSEFLRGEALMGLGRYDEAIGAYEDFGVHYPWMAEFVEQKIASAHLALGNRANAAEAYRKAIDATDDRVASVILLEALAQTNLGMGRYSEAVAAYDEILALAQNSGYRAGIAFQAGQAQASAGNGAEAITRWQAIIDETPAEPGAYQALIELVNREVEVDQFQRGMVDLAAEAWFPAIDAFQNYLDNTASTDERAGPAMLGLGQAYAGAGDFSSAQTVFTRLIAAYPACDCIGQAQLALAAALNGLGNSLEAKRHYRTFARENQTDSFAPEALWRSGLLAFREANELEAAADFFALADLFPESEWTPLALYIIGLGAYRGGFYAQAINVFERLHTEHPEHSADAVQYWLGRSYYSSERSHESSRDEEDELARAKWLALVDTTPDAYYGVLSALALQRPTDTISNVMEAIADIAGPPSRLAEDDGSQAFAEAWLRDWFVDAEYASAKELSLLPAYVAEDMDFQQGKMLLELDQRAEALFVLERVSKRYQEDPVALYALSLEFERLRTYRLSLICMEWLLIRSPANLSEEAPIFLQKRVYPRYFGDLVEAEAATNGIDPLLFFSLIRQESQFERGARSHAAAQGLAQIIPDTADWVADRLNYPNYSNDLVNRPYVNVKFGVYYLDWVRDYLDGNLVSALVGYNAGPGNSQTWREISGPDDALFVETLTFTEPRVYIQKIASNLYHYHRLYGVRHSAQRQTN